MRAGRIVAITALAVIAAAASCRRGGGSHLRANPHPPSTASTTATASVPAIIGGQSTSTVPALTSVPITSLPAGGSRCSTGSLTASLTDLGAAAGTAYRRLDFTNTSSRSCTLHGYPGVSFVDLRGAQIGAPVPMTVGTAPVVTLAPGAVAGALLVYHDVYVGTVADCRPTASAAIKVYPPDQTAALTVAAKLMVCANPAARGTAGIAPLSPPGNLRP